MHEFGIAQGLLEVVLAKAAESGASHIDCIRMEIGIMSGVEEEALEFAFAALSRNTPAANADLVIDKIPLRCYCDSCDRTFECDPFAYRCPACGTSSREVRTGKELKLVSMEVT